MGTITKYLGQVTMYNLILIILRTYIAIAAALSFFGVLDFVWWHIVGDMAVFMASGLAFNYAFSKIVGAKTNYESQYITAEILTLIFGPVNPVGAWLPMLIVSFAATASKYVFAYNKRHIFNPAAFGVLVGGMFFGQGASWWIGSAYLFPFLLLALFVVGKKLRWFHLPFSFLATYFVMLGAVMMSQGADASVIVSTFKSSLIYSSLLFFADIMLVEPLTAPKTRGSRIAYGMAIAALMVLHQTYWPASWPTYGLSIEAALLVGNLLAFALSKKTQRQIVKLAERVQETHDTYSFWFEPSHAFEFVPGQYVEWTLPHDKRDSRGFRRYFTISSSPTENRIRLITKISDKSSSFKKALLGLPKGGEMDISQLQGEFIMPAEGKMAFIAGGVGIAPFLSMAKYLVDRKLTRDVVLFNSNKTERDIAFGPLLEQAKPLGFKTVQVVSDPQQGWIGEKGFITEDTIKRNAPDWKDRIFFLSGPEGMVLAYEKLLSGMGLPSSQIRRDYFPGYGA